MKLILALAIAAIPAWAFAEDRPLPDVPGFAFVDGLVLPVAVADHIPKPRLKPTSPRDPLEPTIERE